MHPRRYLVAVSLVVHVVVVLALFVAGFWHLDRLDAGKRSFSIAVAPTPPPAPSGSPAAAHAPAFTHKPRRIVRELVQRTERTPERASAAPAIPGDGSGEGTGEGSGSGSGSGSGGCEVPPCGVEPTPVPELHHAEEPHVVPPVVIQGLRIAGETQLHPPDPVKTAILRDGKARVVATFKICLDASGDVTSTSLAKSSGYAGYDSVLVEGLRRWRYRPYSIGGRAVPVCGMVTFIYSIL